MKQKLKFATFCTLLILYFATTLPFYPFLKLFPNTTRKLVVYIISFYSEVLLKVLNIKVDIKGNVSVILKEQNFFITSNHLSYLDVLITSAIMPTSFVTSKEVRNTPGLGLITLLGGCLYVDRRSKKNIHDEIREITDALNDGINVLVYPEATSTNGESVLPFKRPLFQAAIDSQTDIAVLSINYNSINGKNLGLNNRDKVCWYGDMNFLDHFFAVCELDEINATLSFCEVIDHPQTRTVHQLSSRAHETTVQNFHAFL